LFSVKLPLNFFPGLQSRLADKETAESRAAALEADNHELAARLVEMKRTEIERMHETNRICEQMVCGAAMPAAGQGHCQGHAYDAKKYNQGSGQEPGAIPHPGLSGYCCLDEVRGCTRAPMCDGLLSSC